MFVLFVMRSYLIEVRGLKPLQKLKNLISYVVSYRGTWVETYMGLFVINITNVVSYRGTWVETYNIVLLNIVYTSYLIEVRGLKHHIAPENQPE